jgi:hypothetical protein
MLGRTPRQNKADSAWVGGEPAGGWVALRIESCRSRHICASTQHDLVHRTERGGKSNAEFLKPPNYIDPLEYIAVIAD